MSTESSRDCPTQTLKDVFLFPPLTCLLLFPPPAAVDFPPLSFLAMLRFLICARSSPILVIVTAFSRRRAARAGSLIAGFRHVYSTYRVFGVQVVKYVMCGTHSIKVGPKPEYKLLYTNYYFLLPLLRGRLFCPPHITYITMLLHFFYLRIGIVSAGGRDCRPGGPGYRGEGPVRTLDHVVQVDPVAVAE